MKVKITRTIVYVVESPDDAKTLNKQEEEDGFMFDLTRLDSAEHISTTDKATAIRRNA